MPVDFLGAITGEEEELASVIVFGEVPGGPLLGILLRLPLSELQPDHELHVDWSIVEAHLYLDESGTGANFELAAYLGGGPLVFEQAGTMPNDTVRGSLDLGIYGSE